MDVKELRNSLDLIPDNAAFSQQFYSILFRDFPETASLFKETSWLRQYSSFMATIAFVVTGGERGENIEAALHKLGALHAHKQVTAEDYPKVGASFIETCKSTLGGAFTEKMEESWVAAFALVSKQMISGA